MRSTCRSACARRRRSGCRRSADHWRASALATRRTWGRCRAARRARCRPASRPSRRSWRARTLEERFDLAHVAALRELARIAQDERVEGVQPERRLRGNAYALEVESLQGGEALRKPALLARGGERRIIAARAFAVEVAFAHR